MSLNQLLQSSIKIDYLKQVTHPSDLIIGQRVVRIGSTSFDIEAVVFEKNENIGVCKSLVTCVAFDFKSNKPVKVHSEIKEDYKK